MPDPKIPHVPLDISPNSESRIHTSQYPSAPDVKMPERRATIKVIVKVQLPLVSTPVRNPDDPKKDEVIPMALIYSEDRKTVAPTQVILNRALVARFKKGEVKAYFHAETWSVPVDGETIELGDRAPDQTW